MTKDIGTTSFSHHVNRKYKDGLFRLLFSEKEGALELYNALNGSSYEDPEKLEITTIDDVIYMGMKNDLSFLVEGKMHLLEEQSSWSCGYRNLLRVAAASRQWKLLLGSSTSTTEKIVSCWNVVNDCMAMRI